LGIKLDLDEKTAKDLVFVLSHDLISGLLPSDKVDTIHIIKSLLETELEKLEKKE